MKLRILLLSAFLSFGTVCGLAQFVLSAGTHQLPNGENWISIEIINNSDVGKEVDGAIWTLIIGRDADAGGWDADRPAFTGDWAKGTAWTGSEALIRWKPDWSSTSIDPTSPPFTVVTLSMDAINGEAPSIPPGTWTLASFKIDIDSARAGNYPLLWGLYGDENGDFYGGPNYMALDGTSYTLDLNDGVLQVVPEPATSAVLGGLGLLAFAGCRRFRK